MPFTSNTLTCEAPDCDTGNPGWNCHAWIAEALRALGEHPGAVKVTVGKEAMVGWLRETMQEQWDLCELAEDHFFDCAMR